MKDITTQIQEAHTIYSKQMGGNREIEIIEMEMEIEIDRYGWGERK